MMMTMIIMMIMMILGGEWDFGHPWTDWVQKHKVLLKLLWYCNFYPRNDYHHRYLQHNFHHKNHHVQIKPDIGRAEKAVSNCTWTGKYISLIIVDYNCGFQLSLTIIDLLTIVDYHCGFWLHFTIIVAVNDLRWLFVWL